MYEWFNYFLFVIMWGEKIKDLGWVIEEFVSFFDFVLMVLDVVGIDVIKFGM